MNRALLILHLSAIAALSQSIPLPPATVGNASYGPHERHRLDLWQAKTEKPAPLVIFIHGGGWHGGDKGDVPGKLLSFMLEHGVSVAAINYRFTSMAMLPAPQRDAARAVQFLRGKAGEWGLDPRRFAAYGVSAGGCSALWLACHDDLADPASSDPVGRQSSRLQAAVGMSPQTCLEPAIVAEWIGDQVLAHPMIARSVQAKMLDEMKKPRPDWVRLLHEASPITHVSADDPPLLISNPRFDPLPAVTAGSAIHHALFGRKLKEKADASGSKCLLRIEDQPSDAVPAPEAFLLEHLARSP